MDFLRRSAHAISPILVLCGVLVGCSSADPGPEENRGPSEQTAPTPAPSAGEVAPAQINIGTYKACIGPCISKESSCYQGCALSASCEKGCESDYASCKSFCSWISGGSLL
jgi:hypothetical protein